MFGAKRSFILNFFLYFFFRVASVTGKVSIKELSSLPVVSGYSKDKPGVL
jgi:hypothetical protein